MSNRFGSFGDHWANIAKEREKMIAKGQCQVEFFNRRRFQVVAPDSEEFRLRALLMGGQYRKRTLIWSFRAVLAKLVIEMCCELFPGKVTVKPYRLAAYKATRKQPIIPV